MRERDRPATGHGDREDGGGPGLTKFEATAISAMQGLLSRVPGSETTVDIGRIVRPAISCSTALWDEIEGGE